MSSPRTALRLNRILAMLPWVIAHPGATVDDVQERFGYTHKELVNDLNLIFVCGLPGYGPGELMDAFIDGDEVVVEMADYFSKPLRLTPPEALGLLASGLALTSTGRAPKALESAVRKLQKALLPEGEKVFVVDLAEPASIDVLRDAAAAGEVVRITYTGLASGETTVRDIEPWTVFSTLGNWYVSAYCRRAGGERVFRLDRIRDAATTGSTFTPPKEPPPPVVHYTPGEEDVRATIRLAAEARWVSDYYPVEMVAEHDDGSATVRFSASDPSVAARLLLRLGATADLVEGPEVGEATEHLRSRILTRYRMIPL